MSEYKSFLDPLNEAEDAMRGSANHLDSLAASLYHVGNQALSEKIGHIADDLRAAMERLGEGRNMALNDYLGAANQGTNNMLNAALAMAQR